MEVLAMKARDWAYCGVLGAAALLLPLLFHLFHLGALFMPMYLPLVALAFFVGPRASASTAFVVPLLSGAASGMPPFYPPVAPAMSVELAVIAVLIGGLRSRCAHVPVWLVLALALAVGRLVNFGLLFGAAHVLRLPAGFVAGLSLVSGWPGLILMMVVIPQLVRLSTHDGRGLQ
jgi:hypothetical protein